MKIYLAGGYSGNLKPDWNKVFTPPQSNNEQKLYLAGDNGEKNILQNSSLNGLDVSQINILESFYYLRSNKVFPTFIPRFGSFLLDSGAFTFMQGSHKGEISWDKYVEEYAAFINKWDIKLFFELDIDSIVGLAEVERLRAKLEDLTHKKPIPVWHKNRGKEYFIRMCEDYPYVALGGIAIKEIPINIFKKYFPWFISTAHEYGTKIHGLGYTYISDLSKYHFDSVDSTAWLYGNRSGYIYQFNPSTGLIDKYPTPDNHRLKSKAAAIHNFKEWVKFGRYAELNL